MLVTVAAEMRQDVFTLWDEPYWRILYVFYHLQERDERIALRRRSDRVDMGMMASLAHWSPEALKDELRAVQAAIADNERPVAAVSDVDDLRARGMAMADRIEKGRALSPEALVS